MLNSRLNYRIPLYLFTATVFSFLISLFLLQLFAGLLVLVYLFEQVKNKKAALDYIAYIFLAFVVVRILTALLSEFPAASNQLFYKDALFFLSFFAFSFYLKVFDEKKTKLILNTFLIAGVVVAIIGLTLFITRQVPRAQSFTTGYSTFSSYLLVVFSFGVISFMNLKGKKERILWLLGLVLILAGIITSLGRTNIVIAAVVFIAAMFISKVRLIYVIAVVVLTAAVSYVAFNLNYEEVNQRINEPTRLSDRDILLNTAEELFFKFEHPLLGYGPRTFHEVFTNRDKLADKGVGSWHNDFIQVYFESGTAGLISFLILILFPIVAAFKLIKKNSLKDERRYILLAAVIAVIALVMSALTAGFVNSPVLSVLFAFLIAIISSVVYTVNNQPDIN